MPADLKSGHIPHLYEVVVPRMPIPVNSRLRNPPIYKFLCGGVPFLLATPSWRLPWELPCHEALLPVMPNLLVSRWRTSKPSPLLLRRRSTLRRCRPEFPIRRSCLLLLLLYHRGGRRTTSTRTDIWRVDRRETTIILLRRLGWSGLYSLEARRWRTPRRCTVDRQGSTKLCCVGETSECNCD
jgi:hypothetical protein